MVQLWVNLPAKFKKTAPKYQAISNDMMGRSTMADGSYVEVIAGEYNGTKGPANTFTPIYLFNAHLKKDGRSSFNFPAAFNTAFLVIKGIVTINGQIAETDHFVLFGNEGESIEMQASEDAIVLILSGEPIHEPIIAYGPFLMNTWEEIEAAVRDVNLGKYGVLE